MTHWLCLFSCQVSTKRITRKAKEAICCTQVNLSTSIYTLSLPFSKHPRDDHCHWGLLFTAIHCCFLSFDLWLTGSLCFIPHCHQLQLFVPLFCLLKEQIKPTYSIHYIPHTYYKLHPSSENFLTFSPMYTRNPLEADPTTSMVPWYFS